MKNFTNNFKQFTSRLSARWLIMALMLLMGTSSAWGAKSLYLDPGVWETSNPVYDVWAWKDGGSGKRYHPINTIGTIREFSVADDVTHVIWFRRSAKVSGDAWSDANVWNKTGDVKIDTGKNLYTMTGWSYGSWSIYTPPTTYTGTINFKRPSGWSNTPNIHMFNNGCTGSPFVDNKAMTLLGTANDGSVWYKYDYTVTTTCGNATIMFNNGGWNNGQTNENLTLTWGEDYCLTGASSTNVTSVTCPVFCTEPQASDFTYTAPANLTYNGSAKSATVTWKSGTGSGTITKYYKSGSGSYSTTAPTNVGTYTVAVKTVAGGNYCATNDYVEVGSFTITCAQPTASNFTYTAPANLTYNGSAKTATVTWKSGTGTGAITVYYKSGTGSYSTTAPTNVGTYTVAVKTVAGGNYCATEDYVEVGTFTIKGITPQASDFTYTKEKDYTGTVLSADVAWKTGLAAGTGGAITTYYKKKDAADNTYTTTKPSAVGVYTIAVTTVAGGNYAAATTKIVLGDFTIHEVCDPITNLTWSITSGSKTTYCSGDKVQVTMTYNGTTAKSYSRAGDYDGNIDFNAGSLASGVVYTFTIINSGTISLTLTGCDGKTATTETLTFNVMADPDTPTVQVVNNIIKCGNDFTQYGKIRITNYNSDYRYKIGANNDPLDPSAIDANGYISGLTIADQFTLYAINGCGVEVPSAAFTITETNNKPTITGNNSFQPGGSTTLTSDKGASTTWLALDGGDLNTRTGASVVFTAKENGTYRVQATYNGCTTTITIKVQDDLYVWVRRPIKKETAYEQFYHEDQNSEKGGDLFYKEFASLPGDYTQYNQDGKAADATCTDKDGYKWYGFIVSKTAIDNDYYFTVHAPNDGGKKGDSQKYGGYYTHTYATQLVDMESDLYFVMDESASGSNRGWYINAPVVVRASGDASFNGNNFADFVPLYVKDANMCGKEVVSFEWQKSSSENGAYTTYKSGEGINNIRTREAGWYRCVVTYGDGKGTATSNAIQVTNTTSGTPGTLADFSSKLPVIMVNTNGVGFPSDKNLATKNTKCASGKRYPSLYADDLKEKVTVDVIIKKGNEILYDRKARMNYRGSSSLNFKKKSYAFCSAQDSCVFDKGRHDYVKTKKAKMLNILGLDYAANDKDWVLYAATPDPSMMRNRLVFDLYQQMRPNDWGVHSTYVELIVDGEYRGVYVFMDKITANENRVNITNENGFIVKFDKTDVVDRVENAEGDQKTFATSRTGTKSNENGIESYGACIDQRFEIEYPEKEDIEDAGGNWEAFYTKVQKRFEDFETALAAQKYDEVRTIIDYDSWADWFIISEFIKNQDGFRASNLFVYNGGKIMAMPLWDQELSMDNRTRIAHGSNSTEGLLTTTASVYSDAFPATFWFTGGGANITGGLLNDPCFVSLVKEKWASYQLGALSVSNITTLVNKYHAELDDNIRNREVTKWPYTEASRGKTTDGDYMGYYAEGDANHYNYQTSKQAIIDFAGGRSTKLGANTYGLGQALYGLNGKALIFTISPSLIETTPWQPSIFTVNAPEGYVYTLDYSELTEADAIIKENGNVYTFKIPRPNDWGTGGNGEEKSVNYRVTATIDADGENSCGTQHANTATLNVEFSDVTEDCETPIEPQP